MERFAAAVHVGSALVLAPLVLGIINRTKAFFAGVGQVSVGGFRRDIRNFFGGTVFNATPEFLALYGLDPALYDRFDVTTQENLPGAVRLTGLDFSYKQALTGLPAWGRGLQVFANASAQRVTGAASAAAIAGYPSLTVPGGMIGGLPMGLTLVAPKHRDGFLLEVGAALERLLPARVPPRLA